jgi:hypothetical protein
MREGPHVSVCASAQAADLRQDRLLVIRSSRSNRIVRLRISNLRCLNVVQCEPRWCLGINGLVPDG